MWQGTKDDLREVIEVVGLLRENAIRDMQRHLDERSTERDRVHAEQVEELTRAMTSPDLVIFTDDASKERFKRSIDVLVRESEADRERFLDSRVEDDFSKLSMRLYDHNVAGESTENDPEIVLPIMHLRQTKNLEIRFGSMISEPYLSVKFERFGGVMVTAASSDMTWVTGALGQLKSVLSEKQPWYAFLANSWIAGPLSFVMAILIGAQAASATDISLENALYWNAVVLGGTVGLYTLWSLVLFRRFELYSVGSQPTIKAIAGATIVAAGLVPWSDIIGTAGG